MRQFIIKLLCFILFYISYIVSSSAIADDDTEQPKAYDSSSIVPALVKPPVKRGFVLVRGERPNMRCNIDKLIRENCEFLVSKKTCPPGYQPEVLIAPFRNSVPSSRFCSLKSYVIATPKLNTRFDSYRLEFAYAYAHFLNLEISLFGHVACPDQPVSITYAIYCV